MNRPNKKDYFNTEADEWCENYLRDSGVGEYIKSLEHYCDLIEELAEKRFKEKIMFEEDCYRLYNAFNEACTIITTLDDSHCLSDWMDLCLKAGNKGVVHHNDNE